MLRRLSGLLPLAVLGALYCWKCVTDPEVDLGDLQ
jgi:hypothetical protein